MSGNITVFPSLKSKNKITQGTPISLTHSLTHSLTRSLTHLLTYLLNTVEKRLPKLAVASLGRGQIIGETEVMLKLDKFEMTYVSSSGCEVFFMPLNVFLDAIHSPAVKNSVYYNKLEQSWCDSLTYSLTHSLTHLTHSPTHSPTHSLTHSLTHLLQCRKGDKHQEAPG
jgi:hypothetical protein